jgi:hypothetical protein
MRTIELLAISKKGFINFSVWALAFMFIDMMFAEENRGGALVGFCVIFMGICQWYSDLRKEMNQTSSHQDDNYRSL